MKLKLRLKLKLKLQCAVSRFVDPGICLVPVATGVKEVRVYCQKVLHNRVNRYAKHFLSKCIGLR